MDVPRVKQMLQTLPVAVQEYYQTTFSRKFYKEKKGDRDKQRLDLVKRLLWPIMGDNPNHKPPLPRNKRNVPVHPTWFDSAESLELGGIL